MGCVGSPAGIGLGAEIKEVRNLVCGFHGGGGSLCRNAVRFSMATEFLFHFLLNQNVVKCVVRGIFCKIKRGYWDYYTHRFLMFFRENKETEEDTIRSEAR